ncbi:MULTISPECIES: 2-amino-4-hydroxy-6-hydroxymethyldihydropteridine diphosphokinase [unclassified Fusibacter]|uniref:2-amino-4-hydroxy-6- hydroxymethyldihydropteridine diphosphokinase n=1 Tax=unclassified Fusibacter TaxID=2624464 RepID=UPI00101304B4|nr:MULTISPECIES: 2-amino-4-hydroxy-6-hydroxymethyldihydropteridine diphosphokinase [unclassified Fusibacter]MCK8058297.1 2-amino-4-hydroxy-6-hydroxymethyldihydropteridine diphosphokinase [Fusibacter sp. A2]NPE20880.1 2-amino-4-hydroxy-6-hydroxymethyldihydropteridine diphosphokinase [Fusibacter sp. A1]RXV63084.1 2-amino-4-hydroxy-6-hydroxymethyldihydropteridine diphosphokinase [Fusibacter sp. A1]
MRSIYLSLGSNMGDKIALIDEAILKIQDLGIDLIARSKYYQSLPQGYVEQDVFVNVSILIGTELEPELLLKELQRIELELDRKRVIRWGPRTIDIDIIWIDGYSSDSDFLTVPHPRAFERAFVVGPMYDLPINDEALKRNMSSAWPKIKDQGIQEYYYDYKSVKS